MNRAREQSWRALNESILSNIYEEIMKATTGTDKFNCRLGSQAAAINAVLSTVPATTKQITAAAGLTSVGRVYTHLRSLVNRGLLPEPVNGKWALKKSADSSSNSGSTSRASTGTSTHRVAGRGKVALKGALPVTTDPSEELAAISRDLESQGHFDATNIKDDRTRTLRAIAQRHGKAQFRKSLIACYAGKCAVTGCNVSLALEAAHIIPFFGGKSDHVANGLLLRADIHTLFDLDVLGIDPDTLKIVIAPELRHSSYSVLNGKRLGIPKRADHRPSPEALNLRWKQFCANCKA